MKYTIKTPVGRSFGDALVVPKKPVLIITDTHAPYQNAEFLHAVFDLAREQGIKHMIHAGDLIHCDSYNSQAKGDVDITPIETDIEHARSILYTAQQYFSMYLLPGNHDMYYLKKEKVSFEHFIKKVVMEEKYTRRIKTTEYDYVYYNNFAVIGHPQAYDSTPGKLAAGLAMKYGLHAFIGHDHIHGAIQAENGKWGISIGGSFTHHTFWYKERSYTLFPHSALGFVIIADEKIHHYDEHFKETVYE